MPLEPKFLTTLPPIEAAGRHVKRYHVSNDATPIDAEIEAAAYAWLPELLPTWDAETPPASWVVLHRGRDGGAYFNAYSWVWGNVVEVHCIAAAQPMVDCPDDDPTHFVPLAKPWVGCAWELPTFGHERSAWVTHIWVPDEPDLPAYLADSVPSGPTGGPD